jgi:hypothetical protein
MGMQPPPFNGMMGSPPGMVPVGGPDPSQPADGGYMKLEPGSMGDPQGMLKQEGGGMGGGMVPADMGGMYGQQQQQAGGMMPTPGMMGGGGMMPVPGGPPGMGMGMGPGGSVPMASPQLMSNGMPALRKDQWPAGGGMVPVGAVSRGGWSVWPGGSADE